MAEAAILRVRHCRADIFCRRAPPRCPACGLPLSGAGLSAAPLRLPSPFRYGHRQPRAFLLRPTAGSFLGYEEHDHNCYTYALAFINSVLTAQGKRQMSKSEFTEKFVIPQTKKASKYITLHQELTANEFYIVPLPDQENQS